MALAPGTRLGVYEIVAQIGEGGMGLVYRARDTKLNRDVALKVLPDLFAGDADRLARFTREAQTLASLNHPNIAHIHGLEESGGVRALVMELVEGDDLSQRIARGAIPVDEALPIAKQIAEALEAAHQQGIIHRDLKPANIKLRPDGTVKVLDFGLAKALAPEQDPASGAHRSQSPTITSPAMLTGLGIVLGTAAYMAPEQAKGREADKRSDIWAFGCVLYEMLTGRRPFDGEDMTDVLGAVVRLEPRWEALPSDVPAPVRTLLRQCLVKDRRRRVGDIAAALFVLDHQASIVSTVPVAPRSNRIAWLVAALSIIATVATAVVALRMSRSATLAPELVQFTIAPPEKTAFGGPVAGWTGRAAQLAISPDGRNIVFVAGAQSAFQIWLRPVASAEARPIQGTEGGTFPFWSPNSQFVAFFAGGKLKRVAIAGGPPVELTDVATGLRWKLESRRRHRVRIGAFGPVSRTERRRRADSRHSTRRRRGRSQVAALPARWAAFLLHRRDWSLLPSGAAGLDQDWLARSGRAGHRAASGRFIGNLRLGPPVVRARPDVDGSGVRS